MSCNCNCSNSVLIPWVRGNKLPLVIPVYEVTRQQVTDANTGETVEQTTRTAYTIQDDDDVTVTFKTGFTATEMDFTTSGNNIYVTDNGTLALGTYTIEVCIVKGGDGDRGRWQGTHQVRIYENSADVELGTADIICDDAALLSADVFYYAYALSAYDIAVQHGFDGTEEEWLQQIIFYPTMDIDNNGHLLVTYNSVNE